MSRKPTRKQVTMLVTVSVPTDFTAAMARREVRTLIGEQCNYVADPDMVKPIKIAPYTPPLEAYAVIYDVKDGYDGEDREEYYEMFGSPGETRAMFNEAFGDNPLVHNARLVRILDTIKPQLD